MSELDQYDDLHIFSLLKGGSREAFDEMYSRYWEKLYNYAFHRTQSKDIAFEIVQDIFVSLWSRKEVIEMQTSLSGYLFASVRFQIINHIKNSTLKEVYLKDYVRYISATNNSVEESMLANDLQHALERCIEELPTRCREISRLSMVENWTIDRIATKLNISNRTVENQLALARKHLRTALKDFAMVAPFIYKAFEQFQR